MEHASLTPQQEAGRLAALHRYGILDTPAEEAFDGIARLAGKICQTPIALITLIDEARQWFKSHVGLDLQETPREIAFCRHAITGKGMCLVQDATADDRFRNNPLVTGEPKIRFYAGVPLVTPDGYSLGTLCVIDRVPRGLTPDQLQALEILAREVITQLELRRTVQELTQVKRRLEDLNIELDAFSAAAAHDLRAPLRAIHGYVDALLDDYAPQLPAQAADHLQRIRTCCHGMNDVIGSLLRLSRVSNAELQNTRVNLSAIVREVGDALATREPGRRVELVIADDVHADADAGLMRVLMDNILGNAWKFTRKRGDARVEFGVRAVGPLREYVVRDNGVGFDAQHISAPLRPFTRMHSDVSFEGIGLGLTIAERIVRRHGGELRIEGVPGQGAIVTFTLPAAFTR